MCAAFVAAIIAVGGIDFLIGGAGTQLRGTTANIADADLHPILNAHPITKHWPCGGVTRKYREAGGGGGSYSLPRWAPFLGSAMFGN
jgi:hypothetical protein